MSEPTQPSCTVIRAQEIGSYEGKQGMTYFAGIAKETTGAQHICMTLLTIQPGQKAKAHLHEHHETAIYQLNGTTEFLYGEQLEQRVVVNTGDFVYIPAGMPHLPWNPSQTEVCKALIARTDPNEQESVVLLPELDAKLP